MKKNLFLIAAMCLVIQLVQAQQIVIPFNIDGQGNIAPGASPALDGNRITAIAGSKLTFQLIPPAGNNRTHAASVEMNGRSFLFQNNSFTIPDNLNQPSISDLNSKLVNVKIDGQLFPFVILVPAQVVTTTSGNQQAAATAAKQANKSTQGTDQSPGIGGHQPYLHKSIYYDAYALSKPQYLTEDDWEMIIQYYYGTKAGMASLKKLVKDPAMNPYLAATLDTSAGYFLNVPQLRKAQGDISNLLSQGLSSLSGLDVTKIVDGFAKFLVKRTKQEMTIAFFSRFADMLSKKEFVDLRTVFPQTYQALVIIGQNIYNYQRYIQILRESFEKDLSTLLTNLPTIGSNHPDIFTGKWLWLRATLDGGCYIAGQLRDKIHPGEILNDYPGEFLDSLNPDMKGTLQTLQLVSASLRDTVSNNDSLYWVSTRQMRKLIADEKVFKIYLGLICQKANTLGDTLSGKIQFEGNVLLHDLLVKQYANLDPLRTFITGFSTKAAKLNALIIQYKKPANDSLAYEQYYTYFSAALNLLKQCSQVISIPAVKDRVNPDLASHMKTFFDVTTSTSNLVLDISRRNYSVAILDALNIYDAIRVQPKVMPVVTAATLSAVKVKKQSAKVQVPVDTILANETKRGLFECGSFMAAMVQAKSSDDIESAIEAFALPSGSSRIKRESLFNVSLNAYPGLFLGHESITGIKNNSVLNSYGVTAPIGIAISMGNKRFFWLGSKDQKHWSYSLFISLVDIGAAAAFRFNDDTTARVPTIQLKDIISPGAFLSIGIPKCPLSVNLGAQMGPNLRKVYGVTGTQQSNDYANQTYLRLSVGLCVDIPAINLYTKPAN